MALIHEFENLSEGELQALWRDGFFVFDTSVLLSLHRYRNEVRTDFVKGVNAIRNQVWIPFQVAIEYENNRPKVVAEKRRLLEDVKAKVASIADEVGGQLGKMGALRRHSHVDAETFLANLRKVSTEFCVVLDELGANTPGVYDEDPVRRAIETLFSGRIGAPPGSQAEIDAIDESAKKRYQVSWPPGYLDQAKDSGKETNAYAFGGLIYQRKNGDLYLWEQIKKKSKLEKAKAVCLITDDQKDDWWWTVDSQGKKRLGARPELREEILRESGVQVFAMHTPDSFLVALNKFRNIGIQADTVSEVREISQERRRLVSAAGEFGIRARAGVLKWCIAKSATSRVFERESFPDFIELDGDDCICRGFEVVPVIASTLEVVQRIERRWASIEGFLSKNPAADLRLMFVFNSEDSMRANFKQIREFERLPDRISLCAGYMAGELYRHSRCFLRQDVGDSISIS